MRRGDGAFFFIPQDLSQSKDLSASSEGGSFPHPVVAFSLPFGMVSGLRGLVRNSPRKYSRRESIQELLEGPLQPWGKMDEETRKRLISEHQEAIRRLEAEPATEKGKTWPPDRFYLVWHVVIGLMLGTLGAGVTLLVNILGAPLFGQRPLELIRVYLTFPMGERALEVDQGVVLFVGCLLYLVTGALYGVLFHLGFQIYLGKASFGKRLGIATLVGLGLWILNFYLILSWLQPMLLGDNWIVRLVPPWVGALTHLAFAWTLLAGETWGHFEPYRRTSLETTEHG